MMSVERLGDSPIRTGTSRVLAEAAQSLALGAYDAAPPICSVPTAYLSYAVFIVLFDSAQVPQ